MQYRAPYSYTITNSSGNTTGPANTLSKGIWKSLYLSEVPLSTVAITHMTPHTRYNGAYPTARLVDGEHGGFAVNVTTYLWAPPGGAKGNLSVAGSWAAATNVSGGDSNAATMTLTLPAGESVVSSRLTATAKQVQLWWPNGVGAQPLYAVNATLRLGAASVTASRKIGFRYAVLVTGDDTNAQYVQRAATEQGTELHGMMFRVNGAAMFTRGANMM